MNENIFCSRKGGATINRKFYPHPSTSTILGGQIRRQAEEKGRRNDRRAARQKAEDKRNGIVSTILERLRG